MSQPRKHYYVPQFYLAGFTKDSSPDSPLYVCDQGQLKSWKSTPRQSAHQRDFHRVATAPGGDEMAIEKSLGTIEGNWATVLKTIVHNGSLPDGEAFGELMMFVAFMAVRVPRIRDTISTFLSDVSKTQLLASLAHDSGQRAFRQSLNASGASVSDEDFVRFIEFARSGEYDIDFEKTWHVKQMVEMGVALGPILSRRQWQLWPVAADVPDLFCSDSPVTPSWIIPPPSPLLTPAFGLKNTIVSVPLHRRLALVGVFEDDLPETELDVKGVASINSMTGCHANQIYSSEADFIWMTRQHEIGHAADLLRQLQESK